MNAKYTPSECVTDGVAGVNEKRDATSRSLASHYETSSEWLAEAIQTCKRKILEGTGHEVTESKRMKPTTASDKENVAESVGNSKMLAQTKLLKKAISAASGKKAIPASAQKAPASKFDRHPSYLRIISLKVSDLKVELRQRGLDTTGLKKELQDRLLKDVVEGESKTQASKNASKSAASLEKEDEAVNGGTDVEMKDATKDFIDAKKTQASKNASKSAASLEKEEEAVNGGTDVEMKDATKDLIDATMNVNVESGPTWNESLTDVTARSVSGKQASASKYRAKVQAPDVKETAVGKSFLKSTAEIFSPGRIASKVMPSKQVADVSVPSSDVPCVTKQKPEVNQPLRNSLACSFKKTASAILSASAIGKAKTAQSSKSLLPNDKTAKAPDAVKSSVVYDLVDPTEIKSSSAQPKQSEISWKPQSQPQPSKPVASAPSKLNHAGAATKEKRNKTAADRMARLAEIRGKSKPVAGSKPVTVNQLPALSASKRLQLSSAKDSKSDRKGLLTAQMREKAAAGLKMQNSSKVVASSNDIPASKVIVSQQKQAKAMESVALVVSRQSQTRSNDIVSHGVSQKKQANGQESLAPVASQPTQAKTHETVSSGVSQQKQAKAQEIVAPAASQLTQAMKKETEPAVVSQQNAHNLVPKITASPKVVFAEKLAASTPSAAPRSVSKMMTSSAKKAAPRPDILSPMSTYEISDREQSDTDDSDSECDQKRKKKKKVPSWAQRSNLMAALELQYVNKDGRLDPETIFPPVSSCNLEEIFDQKKSRYNRRTSSANWSKDGVTLHEIVNYKRTMGY